MRFFLLFFLFGALFAFGPKPPQFHMVTSLERLHPECVEAKHPEGSPRLPEFHAKVFSKTPKFEGQIVVMCPAGVDPGPDAVKQHFTRN